MVKKLRIEEQKKIEIWAKAQERLAQAEDGAELSFFYSIVEENKTIPVILETPEGQLIYRNLDTSKAKNPEYVRAKLEEMKNGYPPITIKIMDDEVGHLYYSDSYILKQLRNYPIYQLGIVSLFIFVSYFAFSVARKSEQNKVWVGLAKETAHQLGTPISSLLAWADLLEIDPEQATPQSMQEMKRDIQRLIVITERFSKIGSEPELLVQNINNVLAESIVYMKTRTSDKIEYVFVERHKDLLVRLNKSLLEWVIENLCKNAIDAMSGSGKITISIFLLKQKVYIDISDNGKGIPSNKFKTIFKPGYTTKKRGWGLGLSLVRRIITEYHRGSIFVKESIPNEKTTFRIIMKCESAPIGTHYHA
ncbi:MAG: HAMP domain-containing histidine kinase [Bacteroidia bacterium]|nr:HAMP domain-containing histidine kinase [Bacteroidota bacterium]MCZ2129760.1 HAMP domain-containing histidine kinase [Bacteroidia bacterium]